MPVAVWAPLPENGEAAYWPTDAAARLRTLALMRMYPSQWRVLAVLGPLLALASSVRPGIPLQPVSLRRLRERPMAGPLFYECRRRVTYEDVAGAISRLPGMVASTAGRGE